jgi:osmoprotectant transport system substrate-binding protein
MRTRTRWLLALLAVVALLGASCGDDGDSDEEANGGPAGTASETTSTSARSVDGPTITIGVQDFGESVVLAEVYGQALEAQGFDVQRQELGGFRDLELGAFESGDINMGVEYVASMLEFLNDNAGEATGDIDETFSLLEAQLDEIGLVAFEPAQAVNTNVFVVTADTAEELGLESISDLADHVDDLTMGGPADCETNPFCLPGLQSAYDIDLSGSYTSLDTGATAAALDSAEIDVAVLFSTDGILASEDYVVLEDDQDMFAADNIVPVATDELAEAYGDDLVTVLDAVSAALTTDALVEMNERYDVDRDDASTIAREFLEDAGLL